MTKIKTEFVVMQIRKSAGDVVHVEPTELLKPNAFATQELAERAIVTYADKFPETWKGQPIQLFIERVFTFGK